MIVKVKGSHDVFRGVCQTITKMAKEQFSEAKDSEALEDNVFKVLSDLTFCISFWPYEVNVPKEHFEFKPSDDLDEEIISEFSDEEPYFLLTEVFMLLAFEIVERFQEMRQREIDFENNNLIIVEPSHEVEVA